MNGNESVKPAVDDFDATLKHDQIEQALVFNRAMTFKGYDIEAKANVLHLMGLLLVKEAEEMGED